MRNSAPSCQYFLSTKKREGKFSFHHLLQLPFSCLYYFSARANRFPSFVCALIRLKPIPSGKIETLYRAVHAPQQIKDLVTRMCAFSSISCVCVAVKAQRKTMHRLEKNDNEKWQGYFKKFCRCSLSYSISDASVQLSKPQNFPVQQHYMQRQNNRHLEQIQIIVTTAS
ncbi:Hypothetical protein, putative [Bodo saltans]|uniref:Uncharacterized protein n=1 Tax=Bodo saltans TaxID=75058 RepID=A0A0S4JP21_BODSA|nr:Hypothetical protein, putative [Bodo saltans]|eukprot:CUG93298.1 Hypothetical protein, putative [Bodo saltans]